MTRNDTDTFISNYDEAEGGDPDCTHGTWADDSSCPDCGGETELIDSGRNDDDSTYEIHQCLGDDECGMFDQDGDAFYDGPSDYSERMTERRQMGLCNY